MKVHALGRAREQGSTWSVTLKKPQVSPCNQVAPGQAAQPGGRGAPVVGAGLPLTKARTGTKVQVSNSSFSQHTGGCTKTQYSHAKAGGEMQNSSKQKGPLGLPHLQEQHDC